MLPYYHITSDMQAGIIGELEKLKIYDCHEHLPTEKERLSRNVDAFTLFSHYCRHDLLSVGMTAEELETVVGDRADIDEKWRVFSHYYALCDNTDYFHAAHIALEHLCGEERLTKDNYVRVTEAIRAQNKPGLYNKLIRDELGIIACLNCRGECADTDGGLLLQSLWAQHRFECGNVIRERVLNGGELWRDLGEVDAYIADFVSKAVALKCFGIKLSVYPFRPGTDAEAAETLKAFRENPGKKYPIDNAFSFYFYTRLIKAASAAGLPCMFHSGYWGDYRELAPQNLLPLLDAVRGAKLDVFHVGYPNVREAIMLGKNWSGVALNMAWTYIIGRQFAFDALDEMLDVVPVSKIFGFGGDYFVPEKIIGHLCMARETIAAVLEKKIKSRGMTAEKALDTARAILYENPKRFYNL